MKLKALFAASAALLMAGCMSVGAPGEPERLNKGFGRNKPRHGGIADVLVLADEFHQLAEFARYTELVGERSQHRLGDEDASSVLAELLAEIRSGAVGSREKMPDHTRIAPVAPYRPVSWFWSLPIQTTAR